MRKSRSGMTSNVLLVTQFCFILALLLDGCSAKRRIRAGNKLMSPQNITCMDRNLQRDLVWQPPLQIKKGWKLQNYQVERCSPEDCSYRAAQCFQDNTRTRDIPGPLNETRCRISVADTIPWTIYVYKVSALYRRPENSDRTGIVSKTIFCDPIDRNTKLDAPTLISIEKSTSAISFRLELPMDLVNAIRTNSDYDLRITYSFCLFESGGTCTKNDMRNESCDPSATYSNLKEDTDYTISAWYTSRDIAKQIRSAVAKSQVRTDIEYLSTKAQLLIVIGISIFLLLAIVALVVWRTTRRMLHKWEALVHKDLPKYFEEALKDLSRKHEGFLNHFDHCWSDASYWKFDEESDIPRIKFTSNCKSLQKSKQQNGAKASQDITPILSSMDVTEMHQGNFKVEMRTHDQVLRNRNAFNGTPIDFHDISKPDSTIMQSSEDRV